MALLSPSISPSTLTLLALVTAIVYLLSKALYNLYLHPLAHIPGPLLSRLTSKNLTYYDMAGRRTRTIHGWHQIYGPVIRVTPNELSFSDPAVIKEIYGQGSPYMKSPFYDTFNQGPPGNMFDMTSRSLHQERRRLLSHAFAASEINGTEPLIRARIRTFLWWVERKQKTPFDVYKWYRRLALDVVGSLFLGKSEGFGALAKEDPPEYLHHLDNHFLIGGMRWHMPWVLPATRWLPIPAWKRFLASQRWLHEYGRAAVHDYIARYGRHSTRRRDLLTKVITGDPKTAPLSDETIVSEVGSLIIGGTDTTSNTLTFTTYELATHPEWQSRLREEFARNNVRFEDGVSTYNQIKGLEVLDAVVNEGLRMYPAAPATLPRVVPAEGAEIAGVKVPAGTTIGMQAWTSHHDSSVFDNPMQFDPGRWLRTSGGTPAMKEAFMPWSRGPRACMGSHLATMELKLTLSAVVNGWSIKPAEGTDEVSMAMTDHFVPMPAALKCELIFQKVRGTA